MKNIILSIILLFPAIAHSGEQRIELNQAISVSPDPSDVNYYLSSDYYWVGKNSVGADHESLFGFELSKATIENIASVSFYAKVVLRHGEGGIVHMAIGNDNSWNEQTATYNSAGGNFGNIEDSNNLNNNNLNQYVSWEISVEKFNSALESGYLSVYLFTNSVGSDGTNFHDIASERYNLEAAPFLLVQTKDIDSSNSTGSVSYISLLMYLIAISLRIYNKSIKFAHKKTVGWDSA